MNLNTCFLHLCFEKEKNEIETKQIRNSFKR